MGSSFKFKFNVLGKKCPHERSQYKNRLMAFYTCNESAMLPFVNLFLLVVTCIDFGRLKDPIIGEREVILSFPEQRWIGYFCHHHNK
jgi:hypothetical protein